MFKIIDDINAGLGITKAAPVEKDFASVLRSYYDQFEGIDFIDEETSYAKSVWVYLCVNFIASNIARLPIDVARKRFDGEDVDVSDHPDFRIFKSPNAWQTKYDFIMESVARLLIQGEMYWELQWNGRRLDSVFADWRREEVKILRGKDRPILGFERTYAGKKQTFTPEQVFFIKCFNPFNNPHGLGPISPAAKSISIENAVFDYIRQLQKQGMKLSGVLTTENTINRADIIRLENTFNKMYSSARNAGKAAVLPKGMDFKTIDCMSMRDSEFPFLKKVDREEICAAYGLSIEVFGLGNTTFANKEAARRQAWDDTIIPLMTKIEALVNKSLMPALSDQDAFIKFNTSGVEILKEDRSKKVKDYVAGFNTGALTPNEIRQEVYGLDPIDDDAMNSTYLPFSVTPANGDDADEDRGETDAAPLPSPAVARALPAAKNALALAPVFKDTTYDQRTRIWRAKIARIDRHEDLFNRKMKSFFRKQRRAVNDKLNEIARSRSAAANTKDPHGISVNDIFDIDFWIGELAKIGEPLIVDAFLASMEEWVTGDIEISDSIVIDAIGERVANMSRFINDHTGTLIQGVLRDATIENLGIPAIARRIKDSVFDSSITDVRARRIARTEAVGASNNGTQVGLVRGGWERKIWITSRDDNVRDHHLIDGQVVPVDGMFRLVDGSRREYPNDINERCIHHGTRQPVTI